MTQKRLTIDLESFSAKNKVRARGIATTLESVFDVFMAVFDTQPDTGVNVAWWGPSYPPRTLFDRRPYEIRLTARGNDWPRYVYQFAHELCHVMTNFDRVREHRHKWFEESLCELASLFVLYRLAEVWAADPPAGINASWSYASDHAEYAREVKVKYASVPQSGLPAWLQANIGKMEQNSTERSLNGVVAVALLHCFRQDSSLWRDCAWLNFWDTGDDRTFTEYLDSWDAFLSSRGAAPGRMPALVRALFFGKEGA